MLGNMMNEQLLISGVLEHAIKNNANTEIVSNTVEGGIHRYTIKDSAKRSKKLANALLNLSIKEGDICLLYTSPSPRDKRQSRMPSSA